MIRPTIHGCNFPYRGPKSRTDISALLTSAKYDIIRGQDSINKLESERREIMEYYCLGNVHDNLSNYLKFYENDVSEEISLNKNIERLEGIERTAKNLLFGV